MDYNLMSEKDLEKLQPEIKRLCSDVKLCNLNRRYERRQQRKLQSTSRDSVSNQLKDYNLDGLIFDNGSYTIKINYSFKDEPKIIPNCIMKAKSERKRLFIGNQIDECRDCSGLFYLIPNERGYITKWDVQKPIWDYVFSKNVCPINNYPIIMTQPLFNFKSIQDCIDEIFFEEYEINSMFRANPTDLALLKYQQEIGYETPCLIVDSGYSFTHIIPYIEGCKYFKGIKRINVGGKLLTNYLKDIISYRQYHVMEETYVINQVKEDTCFVSENFKNDLKLAELPTNKNPIIKNYVLPDFNNIRRGYIQDPEKHDEIAENCQILRLNNERFTVPEILFHPSDIGLKSIGIGEAIYKSIFSCPLKYRQQLAKNILCIGGNCKFNGFKERLFSEVRSMIPANWEVNVYKPEDPIGYSWLGGKVLLKDPEFKDKLVTREQYEELGLSAIQEKFNDWSEIIEEKPKTTREIQPVSYIEHIKKYDVFGKGGIDKPDEETKTDNTSIDNTDNHGVSKDNNVSDIDEESSNDNKNNNKNNKKVTRNSTGQVLYSVRVITNTK